MAEGKIEFESGVSIDGKPFIHIRWDDKRAQLTPEEAVQHGLNVIDVAQGALTDAFLVNYLKDKLDIRIDKAAVLLKDFREYRQARISTYQPPEAKEGGG